MNTVRYNDGSKELAIFMATDRLMLTDHTPSQRTQRFAGIAICFALLLSPAAAFAQGPPGFDMRGGSERSYDRGSYDRGGSSRDRSDRGDRGSSGERSSSYSSTSGSTHPSTTSSPDHSATQHRVTVTLPTTYSDVDSDHDGQLGLYEWKKSKRPLAQFNQIDVNHDGFLTPMELKRAESMGTMMAAATPAPTIAPPGSTPVVASTTTTPAVTPIKAVSTVSPEDQEKIDEAQAKNAISFLDKDRDGKLSAAEMANSKTIRPLFEAAGLNFNDPMPTDQFVTNYIKIQKINAQKAKGS